MLGNNTSTFHNWSTLTPTHGMDWLPLHNHTAGVSAPIHHPRNWTNCYACVKRNEKHSLQPWTLKSCGMTSWSVSMRSCNSTAAETKTLSASMSLLAPACTQWLAARTPLMTTQELTFYHYSHYSFANTSIFQFCIVNSNTSKASVGSCPTITAAILLWNYNIPTQTPSYF